MSYRSFLSLKLCLATISFFLLSTSSVLALCGSYVYSVPDPMERCVDASSYSVIYPYEVCQGLNGICCSTDPSQGETCQGVIPPTPTTAPNQPVPTSPPPSQSSCGVLYIDPSLGSESCLDGSGRAINPYIKCASASNACCRGQDLCSTLPPQLLTPTLGPDPKKPPPQFKMCETIADATLKDECIKCVGDESDQSQVATHVWTGLGCLPVSPEGFSSTLLTIALSLGGGFSLLLMIYGAFLVATSAGNPESAQKGKEVFTGAIAGLLFIIFSVVLLRIIGVDILQLPGF